MRRAVGAGLAALAASKVPDADWGDATCAAKDPEVFHNMLAALPAEQREMVEKAMTD